MLRVAINGLGRVGRLILRQYLEGSFSKFEIVAANDLVPLDNIAYLLKYDSVHGRFSVPFSMQDQLLQAGKRRIQLFKEPKPAAIPWHQAEVDVVLECSGRFKKRNEAAQHLEQGVRRVIISAPAGDADLTLVLGVNEASFDPEHHFVISNASCTTNSLAPPLKVLSDRFGIEAAQIVTIHAYTANQGMVDSASSTMIRGRAGAINIIPTNTGADAATELVLPELAGRLAAPAVRVPVPNGSLSDINVQLHQKVTPETVNQALREAAAGEMQGILAYSEEDLVSSDIIGDPHSATVHGKSTRVVRDSFAKIQVWYDNEYAYARRCLDLLERLAL